MKLLEAIVKADAMRPNALDDQVKASWIYELEGEYSEMMRVDPPENTFPEDSELLMPYPHDNVYTLWLMAKIDFALEESASYQNDMAVFNAENSAARSWWQRNYGRTDRAVARWW